MTLLRPRLRRWLALSGLAALAFVVRLLPVLHGGGLRAYGRYDDGVYYAAADALTFGRVPYRHFVLLHPPAIMLVLAPFALVGRITSDSTGMAVGRLAFMAIGAANAVLVALVARRWSTRAAVVSGVLYASWLAAIYTEESTLLEPLGSTALLVALLLLVRRDRSPTARDQLLAGAVLGLAVTLKIWYVAPWVAVVAWQALAGGRRAGLRVGAAGAGAATVVSLPFAILAGTRMWDMVIRDQLLRPAGSAPRPDRLSSIFGLRFVVPEPAVPAVTAVVIVIVALATIACCYDRTARIVAVLFAVNLTVLLASPSYFAHYAHLTAAPAALVMGIAVPRGSARVGRGLVAAATALVLAASATSALRVATSLRIGRPLSGAQLARAAPAGCVAADSDELLIQMNRLSRDLTAGCRVLVDVSGATYDDLRRLAPDGRPLPRDRNAAWQQYIYDYLVSASSFVFVRGPGDIGATVYRRLSARPVLATSDGISLRAGRGR